MATHLQRLKDLAEQIKATEHYIPEKFPLWSDEEILASYKLTHSTYYFTTHSFIKRQNHADEMGLDLYGEPIVALYATERLRNEAATLRFIAENTQIPVPKYLGLDEQDGLLHLRTSLVQADATALEDVDSAQLPTAIAKVEEQMQRFILPELRKLSRKFIGSIDKTLPVFPPSRLWHSRKVQTWPSVKRETAEFVFCHNDLGAQNIFVDSNFHIVSIIDWEFAGFFPSTFELPLWREHNPRQIAKMKARARDRDMTLFNM